MQWLPQGPGNRQFLAFYGEHVFCQNRCSSVILTPLRSHRLLFGGVCGQAVPKLLTHSTDYLSRRHSIIGIICRSFGCGARWSTLLLSARLFLPCHY